MITTLKQLFEDESGATAIEYGLVAALISVAAVATLDQMGSSLRAAFQSVSTKTNVAN